MAFEATVHPQKKIMICLYALQKLTYNPRINGNRQINVQCVEVQITSSSLGLVYILRMTHYFSWKRAPLPSIFFFNFDYDYSKVSNLKSLERFVDQ